MREIRLLWDEHNTQHIALHHVTVAEVEQVAAVPATRWATDNRHRAGRRVALGRTNAGRYLLVVCDAPTTTGLSYPVTAGPMTKNERRDYQGSAQ